MLNNELLLKNAGIELDWDYTMTFDDSATYFKKDTNLAGENDNQYNQTITWKDEYYGCCSTNYKVEDLDSDVHGSTSKNMKIGSITKLKTSAPTIEWFFSKYIRNVVNDDPFGEGSSPPKTGYTNIISIPKMLSDLGVGSNGKGGTKGDSRKALLIFSNGTQVIYTVTISNAKKPKGSFDSNTPFPYNWNGQTLKCKITYPY